MQLRYHCPICGAHPLRFRRASPASRDRGMCPRCGSYQRHRHLWLWLERHTDLLTGAPKTVLHFAPEPGLRQRLSACKHLSYLAGDLDPAPGDLRLDITALDLPDASVDVVLCVHVLEHVLDDAAAMRELHRVVRPGGWGVVQVPIYGAETEEDATVTAPDERLARFGQEDHVRLYGRDFADRLRAAGFDVDVILFRDQLSKAERRHFGLLYNFDYDVDFNTIAEPWEIWRVERPA